MFLKLRSVVVVVVVAGFVALAPPKVEAAGGVSAGSDFWELAVRWVAEWWGEEWEGWLIDPNGGSSSTTPSQGTGSKEEGWLIDPNG